MINSKQHRGCGIQDPGTRDYRRWNTADFSHSAGTAHGAPPLRHSTARTQTWEGPTSVRTNCETEATKRSGGGTGV